MASAAAGLSLVVLQTLADPPELRQFDCPDGRCRTVWLDEPCVPASPGGTVVVAGHSAPPLVLGAAPETVAAAVACHAPALVVLDTCYGHSLPLLQAMHDAGVRALVVGATEKLPPEGLLYTDAFFSSAAAHTRAAAVQPRADQHLEVHPLDDAALHRAAQLVATWSAEQLTAHLQRVWPNLVRVPYGTGTVLVPVPPERF